MNTDTTDSTNPTAPPTLPPTRIFSLLADDRRRHVMVYLDRHVGAIELGELAETIALYEGELSRDRYERIITGLYHDHLPRLCDAGVIRFDLEHERVVRLPAAEQLTPYLDLAAVADRR